jgi:hypothetical protein
MSQTYMCRCGALLIIDAAGSNWQPVAQQYDPHGFKREHTLVEKHVSVIYCQCGREAARRLLYPSELLANIQNEAAGKPSEPSRFTRFMNGESLADLREEAGA